MAAALQAGTGPGGPRDIAGPLPVWRMPSGTTLQHLLAKNLLTMSPAEGGGARRDRTADLLHAMQALSQLSYGPAQESMFSDRSSETFDLITDY
jgi:hypothetical protein